MTLLTAPRASSSVVPTSILRRRAGRETSARDRLAVEEPLEIRLRYGPRSRRRESRLGVTMRTPGQDFELVAGLLLGEAVVVRRADLVSLEHVPAEDELHAQNIVRADLAPTVAYEPSRTERGFLTSSACGVCGKASLESLRLSGATSPPPEAPRIPDAAMRRLPAALARAQRVFRLTGGLHAAALVDAKGGIVSVREDVGRHNAVDKLLGAEFLAHRVPRHDAALLVSGRASFEILQKALAAGVPVVAALGAPSSLAVELAREFGMTLVGFLRGDGYNVYAGGHRVARRKGPT